MSQIANLLSTLLGLYTSVVLLRVWLQATRADFYNPLSQFVVKVTQPILGPLRKILPRFGRWDLAGIILAFVVSYVQVFLYTYLQGGEIIVNQFLINGLSNLLTSAYYLLFGVLILRAILSWVSQGNNPIQYFTIQLTEPILSPIRRVIPPIGGIDLSILVLILGLQFIFSYIP